MISEQKLGENLRKARKRKFLSIVQACEKIPCATSNLSSYERGVRYPPMHLFLQMCELYEIEPNKILEWEIKQ